MRWLEVAYNDPNPDRRLDDLDIELITAVRDDPELSQGAIARKLDISQPTVSKRLKKLKDSGALRVIAGVDLKRFGLHMAKVDITTSTPTELLSTLEDCPFFINSLATTGTRNLTLLLACDDYATLEALINHHVRPFPGVSDVDFSIVVSNSKELVFPVRFSIPKMDEAPCGVDCGGCNCWVAGRCTGCPITGHYKGTVWKTKI